MNAPTATMTVAVCYAACVGVALAQEPETEPAADALAGDEVVVRGQSLGTIRAEIRRAEDAVFTRFNEINSDDEFDIDCRMEVPLGSHVP